jgi:hypothetical protein
MVRLLDAREISHKKNHTQVWAAAYGGLDEASKAALQKTVGAN